MLCLLASAVKAGEHGHAEAQFAALLGDRPQLAKTLDARPEVRHWILQRWGETRPPLVWDPTSPVSGRAAEWDARAADVTLLRVDGTRSGIDQLAHLLFELHNVQGYDAFAAIHEGAVQGEVTREEYASRMLEQEFRALIAARAFFREHLLDLSQSEKKEARAYYRMLYGPDSFEEYDRKVSRRGFDLRDHYRALYDSMVLSEREERQKEKP
jgi:hypothetical protein